MRIRRQLSIKKKISQSDWDLVHDEGDAAEELLKDDRFKFVIKYFSDTQEYIKETVVKNTLKDVEEHHLIEKVFKKVFFFPKKEQLAEMAGEYKAVDKFKEFLEAKVKLRDDWDKLSEFDRVEIVADART